MDHTGRVGFIVCLQLKLTKGYVFIFIFKKIFFLPTCRNNEEKKLDWMYKDSNQIVDKEEYLLGRKVDKQFENSVLPPGKSQGIFDCIRLVYLL